MYNVSLTSVNITNGNSSWDDIDFAGDLISVIDIVNIANYSFPATGISEFIFENTTHGQIRFLASVNGTGNNLTNDIRLGNNSVVVESTNNIGLNKSANVTLYGIGSRGFLNPAILRDGSSVCNATTTPSCWNFTSLTANTVVFNVSAWSNYSIGNADTTSPLVTIVFPTNTTYSSSPLNFNVSLNENG